MYCQRTHGNHTAAGNLASDRRAFVGAGRDLIGGENSLRMRTGDYAQGAIGRIAIVEVQTERDHSLQDLGRRLHMRDAVLDGPLVEPWRFLALPDSDGQILMPTRFPFRAGDLVEEDRLDRKSGCVEDSIGEIGERRLDGELIDGGQKAQEISRAVDLSVALFGLRVIREEWEIGDEGFDARGVNDIRENLEAGWGDVRKGGTFQ